MREKYYNKALKLFGGVIILTAICVFFSGCTKKTDDWLDQGVWDFHIQADNPQQYTIRVPKGRDYQVPTDGVL